MSDTPTAPSKNRMHIDIETPNIHAEVDRLIALGAQRRGDGPCSEHGSTWFLMADPEGNEFCVCDSGSAEGTEAAQ
jgi:predicted enzyme related to lactoylglutathione lyase